MCGWFQLSEGSHRGKCCIHRGHHWAGVEETVDHGTHGNLYPSQGTHLIPESLITIRLRELIQYYNVPVMSNFQSALNRNFSVFNAFI